MIRISKLVPATTNLYLKRCVHISGCKSFFQSSPQHINCSKQRKNVFPFSPISLPSNGKPKVLITRPDVPQAAFEIIDENCEVDVYSEKLPMAKDELIKRLRGKKGVFCSWADEIDKEVIEAAGSDLEVISTMSVGYDHIDLKECKEKGIIVGHTPDVSSATVAEWTVTMMLCAGRDYVQAVEVLKRGECTHAWMGGQGLNDSVVGIVGMGGIGQMICQRVMPFGVKQVLYHDISYPVIGGEQMGAKWMELKHLLRESDFVVSMVNLCNETRELFDAKAFNLMKPSAIFVNSSRAEVVNQKDLYHVLKEKRIRGAAIDVTSPTPLPADHELLTLDNLIVTPHLASAETRVRILMANLAAHNLMLGLAGEQLKAPVPMPK